MQVTKDRARRHRIEGEHVNPHTGTNGVVGRILKEKIELLPDRKEEITEAAEIRMKYSGYIERERELADKMIRLENIKIKGKFDYNSIQSLSTEARQKLTRIDPETMAQASRIPGVSPSDINVLLVLMKR